MKKIFLFAFIMESAVAAFGQDSNQVDQQISRLKYAEPSSYPQRKSQVIDSNLYNRQILLTKSKHLKAAGHVCVWTGAALLTIGTLTSFYYSGFGGDPFPTEAMPFYAGGFACMIASVPLFISSSKKFHKAMEPSAGLKLESKLQLKEGATSITRYPAVSIRLSF